MGLEVAMDGGFIYFGQSCGDLIFYVSMFFSELLSRGSSSLFGFWESFILWIVFLMILFVILLCGVLENFC